MRLWSNNYPFNCDSGVEFYGANGRMLLSKRGKLEIYSQGNERIENTMPKEPALPQNLWVQTRSKPSLHQQMTAFLSENIKVGSHFQFRDRFFRHELLRPMGV